MKTISKEYAEALFMLAGEENKENQYDSELALICEVLRDNPEYYDFLTAPQISCEEKENAIKEAFGDSICENVLSFLMLLLRKGRIRLLQSCAEEYKKLFDFSKNVSKAIVKSAVELTETEKQLLSEKLEKMSGRTVLIDYVKDESLIGGLLILIDGKVLDGSIKTRLEDVKDVIKR